MTSKRSLDCLAPESSASDECFESVESLSELGRYTAAEKSSTGALTTIIAEAFGSIDKFPLFALEPYHRNFSMGFEEGIMVFRFFNNNLVVLL